MTEAFVLGAGLGVRLRPLTDNLPKPLVPIYHKPLITFALDHLIGAGVERLFVNTHRLPERFHETFPESIYRDRQIAFLHEPALLGTGGGLKNALSHLRAESFIVYSGDILSDFELVPLWEEHVRAGNDVTLALRKTSFAPSITLQKGRVAGIANAGTRGGDYDFANVSIWTRRSAGLIPAKKPASFIPTLVQAIARGKRIGGVVVNDGKWFNIGSAAEYLNVHETIFSEKWKPHYVCDADWPCAIAQTAQVDTSAQLRGCSAVGEKCRVGPGSILIDSIVWPGAQIAPGAQLRNCIVRSQQRAEGNLENQIV